jgi:agmatine deiminase
MARKKIQSSDNKNKSLPARQGYRFPAEWEPHESTWIAWPHRRSDWPGKMAAIPWVYGEIVRWLHQSEPVNILVNDVKAEKQALQALKCVDVDLKQVHFWRWPTDRVWTRDSGPIFLLGPDGKKAVLDWRFNAWAKYADWKNDDAIPARVAEHFQYPSWQPSRGDKRVVLEGGSIEVNGQGLLLTTEECQLSEIQARNPDLTREDLESVFADYLGIKKTLWLDRGIAGDDTHGHIDDLARFVGVRTIVAVEETRPDDDNYGPLQKNLERLRDMTDLEGRKLEIVTLPMPAPLYFDGQRLPASYANFYIANSLVLAPTFNDPHDRIALGTLADLFPGRKVVGIHAVDLVWGLGTLHCLTQQEPLAVSVDGS